MASNSPGRDTVGNREAKPSIADLIRTLQFLQRHWKEVGTGLGLSRDTLEKIDQDCRQTDSQKLESVIARWIEEKQRLLLLPELTRKLVNMDFVQQDNRLMQRLNNLEGK